MKVFTANFNGHWHRGSAAVVAENEHEARLALAAALERYGLEGEHSISMDELPLDKPSVDILHDGDE